MAAKKIFLIGAVVLIALVAVAAAFELDDPAVRGDEAGAGEVTVESTKSGDYEKLVRDMPKHEVVIGGEKFELAIAADRDSRTHGLMRVDEIPEHGGMLFAFPTSRVQEFWMGHCETDMDILFLDPRGHVITGYEMKKAPPQREDESDADYRRRLPGYSSRSPSPYVIELQAGKIRELGIKRRDLIDLDLARLKRLAR